MGKPGRPRIQAMAISRLAYDPRPASIFTLWSRQKPKLVANSRDTMAIVRISSKRHAIVIESSDYPRTISPERY